MLAVAAILIVIWPGHDVPMQGYQAMRQCQTILSVLRQAARDILPTISGFHAWCEPGQRPLVS
jgi:hypothetical protein